MATAMKKMIKPIDEYIAGYPVPVQKIMGKLRATIRKAAPKAEETIGYGIPTFKLEGNLVHFGAFKKLCKALSCATGH